MFQHEKRNNEYIFSVSDNGIGLEEQYFDRIFEVFKRLHTIDEYKGAGIGLAIVKEDYGSSWWSCLGGILVGCGFYFLFYYSCWG